MVEAQAQAKQLDSVTDRHQETEVDATRAQEAMGALSSAQSSGDHRNENVGSLVVAEDVALICDELDVTEDVAKRALREAAAELGVTQREGQALVIKALKKLVTS